MEKTLTLANQVFIEEIGGEVLVFSPSGDIIRLSGDHARCVLRVQAGRPKCCSHAALSGPVDCGIFQTPGLCRRSLITSGAIATAGVAITSMATPAVAMASSDLPSVLPDQFIELNGCNRRLGPEPEPHYVFAIGNKFDLPKNCRNPQPSTNVDVLGGLEIFGTTFGVSMCQLDDEDPSGFLLIEWGGIEEYPGREVVGVFT